MALPAKERPLARPPVARGRALGLTVALVVGLTTGCKSKPAPPSPGSVLRLAFARNMIAFELAPGEQASRDVRLAGRERDKATLAIASTDGPATAALLPAELVQAGTVAGSDQVFGVEDKLRAGVRLTFVAKEAGEGLGRVTVTTSLAPPTAPKQLVLYYTWKVSGQASGSRSRSIP